MSDTRVRRSDLVIVFATHVMFAIVWLCALGALAGRVGAFTTGEDDRLAPDSAPARVELTEFLDADRLDFLHLALHTSPPQIYVEQIQL